MDDLILAGVLSIAALYTAGALILGAVVLLILNLSGAVMAGRAAAAAPLLALVLLILAAYAGTGLWLQRTGRI